MGSFVKNMAKNSTNSHQLIFDEVKERLKDQLSSIDTLDTKAGLLYPFPLPISGDLAWESFSLVFSKL